MLSFGLPSICLLRLLGVFYLNKHRHEPWHVCGMALACLACFELAMMSIRHLRCPRDITEEVRVALSKCTFQHRSCLADPRFARVGRAQGWSRVAVHLLVCFG